MALVCDTWRFLVGGRCVQLRAYLRRAFGGAMYGAKQQQGISHERIRTIDPSSGFGFLVLFLLKRSLFVLCGSIGRAAELFPWHSKCLVWLDKHNTCTAKYRK